MSSGDGELENSDPDEVAFKDRAWQSLRGRTAPVGIGLIGKFSPDTGDAAGPDISETAQASTWVPSRTFVRTQIKYEMYLVFFPFGIVCGTAF